MDRSIIIEGVDGMGKSYLAQHLSIALGYDLAICGKAPTDLPSIKYWLGVQQEQVAKGATVLDRVTAFSHTIYDNVFGFGQHRDFLVHQAKALLMHQPVVIYAKTDRVIHRTKHYDDPLRVAQIEANTDLLCEEYEHLFTELGIKPIVYDWTKPGAFEILLERIKL